MQGRVSDMWKREAAIVGIAAALAMALVAPVTAHAATVLEYEPTSNPVADNATRLEVNKLERGSREAVKGASLEIVEEATGEVIDSWVSEKAPHVVTSELDVSLDYDNPEHVYVLRETDAPEGYERAEDTRFALFSVDFATSGTVLSGDDAEFTDVTGSGRDQAFVINLLDPAIEERVIERHLKNERAVPGKSLAQTGDLLKVGLLVGLVAGGVFFTGLGVRLRKER